MSKSAKPSTKPSPRSTIEGLQEELAARRERVTRCEQELAAARSDESEYVSKIAAALGLPNPAARETRRQETLALRKRVRELLDRGVFPPQIAVELKISQEEVNEVFTKIRGRKKRSTGGQPAGGKEDEGDGDGGRDLGGAPLRLPPESGKKGWKKERALALYLEGKTTGEIADAIDSSRASVYVYISQLRREGRLPKLGQNDVPAGGEPESPDEEGEAGEAGDEESGDSVEDLRAEVARQQGGSRTKPAYLAVVAHHGEDGAHEHVAVVDRMGDGVTRSDDTKHQHKVYRFVVGQNAGHGHGGLLAREPGA
jgi:transposase